ncbi:hypothetical protein BZG01_21030 [Labilibaculum manganireducens]|uniref:Uncharacterized protein n=1 Tax=Labilibaculum manganireducens TaxID=1940525 RepID=A0A2N3HQR9_9BACT|nr:tetratricopeptide repeat protein [Labilibaculum manganireducens]PKQ60398.1 hypothetical protein BZG01_21030 [Labilibaculum manganireducens]
MKNKIQYSIVLVLVLLFNARTTSAQKDARWGDFYSNKYFFSYENSKKSVVLYASRDTMVQVWVNGVKDTADYSKGIQDLDHFECWDNGVCYDIELINNDRLIVNSRDNLGDGTDFQFEPEMKSNIFGEEEFYSCTNFKQNISWEGLDPTQVLNLNNTAYYLDQVGCYECAISILEELIKAYPNRIVAYINLGDSYWDNKNYTKAKSAYAKYCELMQAKGKKCKIPKRVFDRMK